MYTRNLSSVFGHSFLIVSLCGDTRGTVVNYPPNGVPLIPLHRLNESKHSDKASGCLTWTSQLYHSFMLQPLSHIVLYVHTIFECLNAGLK